MQAGLETFLKNSVLALSHTLRLALLTRQMRYRCLGSAPSGAVAAAAAGEGFTPHLPSQAHLGTEQPCGHSCSVSVRWPCPAGDNAQSFLQLIPTNSQKVVYFSAMFAFRYPATCSGLQRVGRWGGGDVGLSGCGGGGRRGGRSWWLGGRVTEVGSGDIVG